MRSSPSGSLDPRALKEQARRSQLLVKSATGGWATATPGLRTTEVITVRLAAGSVVASRAAWVPTVAALPVSASTALIFPEPPAAAVVRSTAPVGRVHAVADEDFSAHDSTTHDPGSATSTGAVACVVPAVFTTRLEEAVTDAAPSELR